MNIVTLQANFFDTNPSLSHVNLSSNYLVSLESQMLESLSKLEYLDISHNLFMGLEPELLRIGETSWICLKIF